MWLGGLAFQGQKVVLREWPQFPLTMHLSLTSF